MRLTLTFSYICCIFVHPNLDSVHCLLECNAGKVYSRAGKTPSPVARRQVNFALGKVKIEVQWPGAHVKSASVVL